MPLDTTPGITRKVPCFCNTKWSKSHVCLTTVDHPHHTIPWSIFVLGAPFPIWRPHLVTMNFKRSCFLGTYNVKSTISNVMFKVSWRCFRTYGGEKICGQLFVTCLTKHFMSLTSVCVLIPKLLPPTLLQSRWSFHLVLPEWRTKVSNCLQPLQGGGRVCPSPCFGQLSIMSHKYVYSVHSIIYVIFRRLRSKL